MPPSAKRILIAPLDWGLGHTTRCIPVIKTLEGLGHQVIFAGNEAQTAFVRRSFPDIDVRKLEGYRVRYGRRTLMLTLLWQFPRLLRVIRREHICLLDIVASEKIDAVISDNRYGLWHPEKPCVIMTHQPGIKTGLGPWADFIIRRLHYRRLERFGAVWIPDKAGTDNLGGALSHPPELPRNAQYIGWLSQFARVAPTAGNAHLLILLSGPEPQRSILADKLWAQAVEYKTPIVFVEGRASAARHNIPPHIRHYPLCDAATLQPLLVAASLVICRSGYSTLMDLAVFQKRAILIPTPGQTEQEYLARFLSEKGIYQSFVQKDFSLESAIEATPGGTGVWSSKDDSDMLPILQEWLSTF